MVNNEYYNQKMEITKNNDNIIYSIFDNKKRENGLIFHYIENLKILDLFFDIDSLSEYVSNNPAPTELLVEMWCISITDADSFSIMRGQYSLFEIVEYYCSKFNVSINFEKIIQV